MVVNRMEVPRDKISNSEDAENVLSVLTTKNGIDKNIIANNIDKVHTIGETLHNKQQHIIKFKTSSFKEKIYMAQNKQKKHNAEQ